MRDDKLLIRQSCLGAIEVTWADPLPFQIIFVIRYFTIDHFSFGSVDPEITKFRYSNHLLCQGKVDLSVPSKFEDNGQILDHSPILFASKSGLRNQEEILIRQHTSNNCFFNPHFVASYSVRQDGEFLTFVVDQFQIEVVFVFWIILEIIASSAAELKFEVVCTSFERQFFLNVGFPRRRLIKARTWMKFDGYVNILK